MMQKTSGSVVSPTIFLLILHPLLPIGTEPPRHTANFQSKHILTVKKIRQITMALLSVIIPVFLQACNKNDDPDPSSVMFDVSPASIKIAADDTGAHEVTATVSWPFEIQALVTSDWCKLVQTSTTKMQAFYKLTASANTPPEPRSCSVKFFVKGVEKGTLLVTQAGVEVEPEKPVPNKPENDASFLGLGWNLGNQLDAHINGVANETCWGNAAATQATMNAVKAAGFNSVRIPVTWMGHIGEAPEYKIEAAWLDRVAEIVGYAENAGLKAIVNIHHDGADSNYWLDIKNAAKSSEVNTRVKAQLSALWSQVAKKFADKGDFLVFESMNEIHDGGWGWGANRNDGGKQYATFNEWQQVFVDAVRAAGGENATRWLGIPAYCTNIDLGDYLVLPNDPASKMIVSVHCYEPYEYTLGSKYSEWGHTGAAGKKPSSGETQLVAELEKMMNKWIRKGIGAYIGEFGCSHRSDDRAEAFRKYYLEYYTKAASDRNIPLIYWDNGSTGSGEEAGGLISHSTGAFINNGADIVAIMTKGYHTTDPAYTLQTVYEGAPQ